ncbi:MAG: hypothetical protein CGU29_09090 [Candidatus Dactylopiibacterium carminicum]|uniref:Endonuclease domain-containing protein n=1 Tax=Candidatus Dactylopiibacterium carminicum TaxID=857335 RepID=A0A272ESK6_9RHOO|nr:endonuclease domain-containing protein [Candidatus Dactylopiibacterium carminicum]PAS93101.1 MAG: hypothetical protein CGU29_09090 [Candidatus Dactylopiibacterium carminicum]
MSTRRPPLTPPAPLVRGESAHALAATPALIGDSPERTAPDTPSPDKGRAGEGFQRRFLPYAQALTALARANRRNPTPAEALLWRRVLRHRQFAHYKFHRQKPIGHYIVDFYCAELGLVVEVDGDSHAAQAEYDAARTRFLAGQGLRVLRYRNGDVLQNLSGVFDDLTRHLQRETD